jgi:pyruvate formate lyase activating enzyme
MKQGVIFDIKRFSINDGPGIRTTVFFKGCPMKCLWCHNPESQSDSPQKTGKKESIGKLSTVDEVIREIEKENIFYDESKGGVTFSGGEPLQQPEFLNALLSECHKKEIHTTLDTSGDASPKIFNSLIDNVDLFLYDLKIIDEKTHVKFTGVSNRNILKNLETLSKKKKRVIVRFPIIPGITDSEENIKDVSSFVSSLKNIHEIDLLPYHKSAESKYKRLDLDYKLKDVKPPSDTRMNEIKNLFETLTHGIDIKMV